MRFFGSFRFDGAGPIWHFARPLGFEPDTFGDSGSRSHPCCFSYWLFNLLPHHAAKLASKPGDASRCLQPTILDFRSMDASDDWLGISPSLK